jgi:hypothetical protein
VRAPLSGLWSVRPARWPAPGLCRPPASRGPVLAIADIAKGVTSVGVQLVKYPLRPLNGAGRVRRRGHWVPSAVRRSCHVLSPHWRAGLIAGISLPDRDEAVCHLADTTSVCCLHRHCVSDLSSRLGLRTGPITDSGRPTVRVKELTERHQSALATRLSRHHNHRGQRANGCYRATRPGLRRWWPPRRGGSAAASGRCGRQGRPDPGEP